MPAHLTAVPTALTSVRMRDAAEQGVGAGSLRHPRWRRLSYGLYIQADLLDIRSVATATADVLPRNSGFGHLTSAELRSWWLPWRLGRSAPLFASTTSRVHVQRQGVYVRRSAFTVVEDVDGLPLASAAETLLELAQDLSLLDLVPMVDRALAGGADPAEVLAAARPRSRGARTLRRAVALADPRSESWWESVLRLLHVTTGLGPVDAQVELYDGAAFVARADLHLVGTHRYPECDGGDHRTPEQHAQDLRRDRAMHRIGVERYGYTTTDIAHRPERIIRDAEAARGLRPDPRRAVAWRRLVAASSLTGHGRARLAGRLARYRRAAQR